MCLEKIGKIFLIAANVLFFLGGAALLTVGLISIFKEDLLYKITDLVFSNVGKIFEDLDVVANIDFVQLIKTNAIILCVVGGFIFSLGFLGMCGACRMNSICLQIYAVVVLVLLMGEVGLGVYAYMNAEQFEGKIQDGLRLALFKTYETGLRFDPANPNNLKTSDDGVEIGFDSLQIYLKCCGVSNRSEWIEAGDNLWNTTYNYPGAVINAKVPPSCCVLKDDFDPDEGFNSGIGISDFMDLNQCLVTGNTQAHNVGCYDRLRNLILNNQNIILIVFVCIVGVEILAIAFACYLKGQAEKKG